MALMFLVPGQDRSVVRTKATLASSQGQESELLISEVPVPRPPRRLLCSLSCPESESPVGSHRLPPGNFMRGYFVGTFDGHKTQLLGKPMGCVRALSLCGQSQGSHSNGGQLIPRKDGSQRVGRGCCLKRDLETDLYSL